MRHDHVVIKHVTKLYGAEAATELQDHPFFYISEEIENQFTSGERRNSEGFRRQYPEFVVKVTDNEELDEILPFQRFVVMDHGIGWHLIHRMADNHWQFMICIDQQLQNTIGLRVPPGTLINVMVEVIRYHEGTDILDPERSLEIGPTQVSMLALTKDKELPNSAPGIPKKEMDFLKKIFGDEKFCETMASQMITNLTYILSYFKWAQTQHLIEVKAENPKNGQGTKTAVKKPWLRDDRTHYIYLDSPKQVRDRGNARTGDSTYVVRGHARRGHLRHLTNPRFKNHPKYGKYVAVRPTWVGSRTWTVNGTIYTVKGELCHEPE